MEHIRGVGIKFSYVKCILRLIIGILYTQVGAILITSKQMLWNRCHIRINSNFNVNLYQSVESFVYWGLIRRKINYIT